MRSVTKRISSGIYQYGRFQVENWGDRDGAHWVATENGTLVKDRQGVNLDRPTRREIVRCLDRYFS